MTPEQLQAIKENYSNMNWDDFRENAGDLLQREIDIYDAVVIEGVPALIAEVEWYKRAQKAWWEREKFLQKEIIRLQDIEVNEYYRLRIGLEIIANHNIFTTPQIEVRDLAREVLQMKNRTPEENELIDKVTASLKASEDEK